MKARLDAQDMILMAERLLSGAVEQVLEELGSPPFPDIERLQVLRDNLCSYIDDHSEYLKG